LVLKENFSFSVLTNILSLPTLTFEILLEAQLSASAPLFANYSIFGASKPRLN